MEPIVLDRWFQVWRYTLGHSELVFRAWSGDPGVENVYVLFEAVRAVKLRSSFRPLVLQPADQRTRGQLLAFAGIPARHHASMLCLALPYRDTDPGFVVCARATVFTAPNHQDADWWRRHGRQTHLLNQKTVSAPTDR